MTKSDKVRQKVFELLREGLSPEKIVDMLSKDSQWVNEDYPTPKTIRNWLKEEKQHPILNPDEVRTAKKHDKIVFKQSDAILNENKLDNLVYRLLVGNRFYLYEAAMLDKYLYYFDKESNKYIIPSLKEQSEKCNKMILRLSHFIRIHSDIISYNDTDGTKYKMFPGGNADRFYHDLTNDKTRPRAERRLGDKVDRLSNDCQSAYKEYRSNIRETLFL